MAGGAMGQCCSAHAADGAGSKGEVTLDDVGGARGARAASLASADGFADCRSTLSAPYSADEGGGARARRESAAREAALARACSLSSRVSACERGSARWPSHGVRARREPVR